MEEKLKKILDELDLEETEKLLDGIDAKDPANSKKLLNEERIRNMVLEQISGGETKKEKKGKITKINWAAYASVAAAVVIFICTAVLYNKSSTLNSDNQSFAAKENAGNSMDMAQAEEEIYYNDSETEVIEEDGVLNETVEAGSADNYPSKEEKKESNKKNNKNNKPQKNESDDVMVGENIKERNEYFSPEEIEKILADSDAEIDMDSFYSRYNSLQEMIDNSDYIVRGEKLESSFVAGDEEKTYNLVTNFKVNELIVDNVGDDIKENIKIDESIIYNSETETITRVAGYNNMVKGQQYVLFIKKGDEGHFKIAGTVYGKISVDELEEYTDVDTSCMAQEDAIVYKKIVDEARENYIQIKNSRQDEEIREENE